MDLVFEDNAEMSLSKLLYKAYIDERYTDFNVSMSYE